MDAEAQPRIRFADEIELLYVRLVPGQAHERILPPPGLRVRRRSAHVIEMSVAFLATHSQASPAVVLEGNVDVSSAKGQHMGRDNPLRQRTGGDL